MSTTGDGKEDAPRPDGGVEPETVTGCGVWIKGGKCGEDGLCGTCWAKREGVHVPTLRANLRLVEEELRQAREERDNWKERAGANDQDREDESQLRAEAEANWQRESALLRRAEADRDRLAEALREIADQDWVENVLDPQRAARIAVAAPVSPVQGEHEQGGRCIVCGGRGRRSSWVNELGREVEADCPDCNGSGCGEIAQDGDTDA